MKYTYTFVIPSNITDNYLIHIHKIYNIPFKYDSFKRKVILLLDKLYDIHLRRLTGKENGFYGMGGKRLQKLLGPRYAKTIIKILYRERILYIDREYIPGAKTRAYRIAPKWLENGHRTVHLPFSCSSHPNRENWKARREILRNSNDILQRNTLRFMEAVKVPDFESVDVAGKAEAEIQALKYRLDAFKNREFHCSIDDFGRLHSNLTNLDKEIRAKLTLYGEPCVEVDVRACFPTLLLSWVKDRA